MSIEDDLKDMDEAVPAKKARTVKDDLADMESVPSTKPAPVATARQMPAPVSTAEHAPTPLRRYAANPYTIWPQVALNKLTGGGAAVLGGATGIGTTIGHLVSGDTLKSSLEYGGEAASKYQQEHTYQPTLPQAQTMLHATDVPAQVVGKVADRAGDVASDVVGPATGATVRTLGNILPAIVLHKAYNAGTPGAAKPATPAAEAPAVVVPPYRGGRSAQFAKAEAPAVTETPAPSAATVSDAAADSNVGVGAARANNNPYTQMTGEESARGGVFPMVKVSKIAADVPAAEKVQRAQIVGKIAQDTGIDIQPRTGVITGNENTLRNEYTEAKSANPTEKSQILKEQIANEQQALSKYAEKRIENTGASPTLITPEERGERINGGFYGDEGLRGFLKTEKQKIYDQAYAQVGDNPIQTPLVDKLLTDPQSVTKMRQAGIYNLTKELYDIHSKTGIQDITGKQMAPGSIASLEELRKSINDHWTPDNASILRRVTGAIDDEIASAGGPGLYQQGRNLHEFEKTVFDAPGMKDVFGDSHPVTGIKAGTPAEKIPQKLNALPNDQWKHIYDTADQASRGTITFKGVTVQVPPEVQQAAAAARNEMAGSIAREIYEAGANKVGTWNANAANKVMNARAAKIEHAFPPDEQQAFHTLNYGGNIMPATHPHEGAALQTQRVGVLTGKLPTIGREAGAMTRIPGAATVGEKVGEKLQGKVISNKQRKAAQILRQELEANQQLTRMGDIANGGH